MQVKLVINLASTAESCTERTEARSDIKYQAAKVILITPGRARLANVCVRGNIHHIYGRFCEIASDISRITIQTE